MTISIERHDDVEQVVHSRYEVTEHNHGGEISATVTDGVIDASWETIDGTQHVRCPLDIAGTIATLLEHIAADQAESS